MPGLFFAITWRLGGSTAFYGLNESTASRRMEKHEKYGNNMGGNIRRACLEVEAATLTLI
ncbi:MAG: hypothetical protein ACYC05_15065 [Sulfuricella sp.]